jgi:hypothetical protein
MTNSALRRRGAAAAALVAAAILAGCGGAGTETAGIDRGGARTPVIAQAPISGFGSIIVNGVHYDIAHATITVNEDAASGDSLRLGQLVTVVGERDDGGATGVADTVLFDANVRGPAMGVDASAGTLTVLHQRVTVDASTVLDFGGRPPALDSLAAGEIVEVSGFVGAGGSIAATRVEAVPSGNLRVLGVVSGVNTSSHRFRINGLTVDYSAVQSLEGFATGQPVDGARVVVTGTTVGAAGELRATRVRRLEASFEAKEGREAEVEGLITRFASVTDFDVSGTRVTTAADTAYQGGTAAALASDVKVHVEGTFDANGVVVARKIEIESGSFDD